MRAIVVAVFAALALSACRAPGGIPEPSPGAVRGRIDGVQQVPGGARVQVYRLDSDGRPTPDPFESVELDRTGRFTTRALSPGRYRVVYRNPEGPPSSVSIRVPTENRVVLRPLVEPGLVQLRVIAGANSAPTRCRLTEVKSFDGIPDVREFECAADAASFVRGLRPGRWFLDLPETGATTEVELVGGESLRELVIDPPPFEGGADVRGQVRRIDGSAAAWVVVAARPLGASGETAGRWGRYATTDREGNYRVVGIPPGTSLVRIESREVAIRIPPAAHLVPIPPSGTIDLGFVVEP